MRKYFVCGLLLAAAVATWEQSGRVSAQADVNPLVKDANAPAPVPAQAPAATPETIDRIYDVRDLTRRVKDYPLSGGPVPLTRLGDLTPNTGQPAQQAGQQPGAQPQPAPDRSQQEATEVASQAESLQGLILGRVDTNSWKNNGGTVGSIAWFDGQFIVTQTAENHKAIAKLLDDLRTARNCVVRVRADWVLLSPGQVEKLEKNGGDDKSAAPEIARDLLGALPGNTVHYSGSILCFSGQTVSIASGRAKSLVTSLSPVPMVETAVMTPGVTYVQEGLLLQVTPTVTGDSATLDLASTVTEPNKFVQHATTQPAIDRVDSDLQHLHTTVQVPLNKPVLIAGTTADPNPQEPAGRQLYLIIEADSSK